MSASIYDDFNPSSEAVPADSFPIVPSDTQDLPRYIRAIRATVGGSIKVKVGLGVDRTINIADGETRYVVIAKVYQTGTTATGLEGMP